jgi:hypothetical protein
MLAGGAELELGRQVEGSRPSATRPLIAPDSARGRRRPRRLQPARLSQSSCRGCRRAATTSASPPCSQDSCLHTAGSPGPRLDPPPRRRRTAGNQPHGRAGHADACR